MLYSEFLTNEKQIIHKWVHYFPIYEKFFHKFVNQSVIFWEIGVSNGGAAKMWKRYLGPFATIVGIDINPKCKLIEEPQIHICIGDQSDTTFLQEIIDKYGIPDIVLDDGSHMMKDVCATFNFLYDKVSKNGVYLVEDMHASYYNTCGGGLKRRGTFIELCKDLVDSLNARSYHGDCTFADSTYSISFFDGVVVFEKKKWMNASHGAIMSPSPFQIGSQDYSLWYRMKCFEEGGREPLSHFLTRNNIQSISIYGTGKWGELLYDEFLGTDIDVKFFVSPPRGGGKYIGVQKHYGLPCYLPDEIADAGDVDLIIIIPSLQQSEIKQYVCKNVRIVDLADLIEHRFEPGAVKSDHPFYALWCALENAKKSGNVLSEHLISEGTRNIAIYGMGLLGHFLYSELKNTDVNVKYCIDKNIEKVAANSERLPGFLPERLADAPPVDLIVVTPYMEFTAIEAELRMHKTDITVIGLNDLIQAMVQK